MGAEDGIEDDGAEQGGAAFVAHDLDLTASVPETQPKGAPEPEPEPEPHTAEQQLDINLELISELMDELNSSDASEFNDNAGRIEDLEQCRRALEGLPVARYRIGSVLRRLNTLMDENLDRRELLDALGQARTALEHQLEDRS